MKSIALFALFFCASPALLDAEEAKPATEVAVQVAKVVKATLYRKITAYGHVEPEPASAERPPATAKLAPALAGLITEVHGVEGMEVKKGDILFKLDSRAADAAVTKGESALVFATRNVERQKKLLGVEGTSEKLMLESEEMLHTAETALATAKVQQSLLRGEAPFSGRLVKFIAHPGEPADATTILAEIVDMDRLVVTLQVPRPEAAEMKIGQKAEVLAGRQDKAVESSVSFISPVVDPLTDTVVVRLALPKGSGMHPGQFVSARIVTETRADRLAVPRDSVYTDHDGKSTLSIVEDGIAKQKVVKAGLHDGGLIEVAGEGVTEGTTVVTLGSYALPKETKVRILEAKEETK
jgi:membrane fusion protein, multidrug efflux system